MLSPAYNDINAMRNAGNLGGAMASLQQHRPSSDDDAFEAVVCLFLAGDTQNVLHVCSTYPWSQRWAQQITQALSAMIAEGDPARALAPARAAVADEQAGPDVVAFFLSLLLANGLQDEAYEYARNRLQPLPFGETFLLVEMAQVAAGAGDWTRAYQLGCAVLATDALNYRALIVLANANFHAQNYHEALGNAQCANLSQPGSPPAVLQIMRCQNKLSDFYSAVAAYDSLAPGAEVTPDIFVELGIAYSGLERPDRAAEAFRQAVAADPPPPAALRALLRHYMDAGDEAALRAFANEFAQAIDNDVESLLLLAQDELTHGRLEASSLRFKKCHALHRRQGHPYRHLPWPVPEPRLRHDYEQLELLQRRGKLTASGHSALQVLKPYYEQSGDIAQVFAPAGEAAERLREALCEVHYEPDEAFAAEALTRHDYQSIEACYDAEKIVVIDDFLTPEGLAALRRFSEEATVWKDYNPGGYVAALMLSGFAPRVLLKLADELRQRMPNVIRDYPLLQAWGFKYDQRMQGINMHADFARVNVNFWITPGEGCADPTRGGMVVYDYPVPKNWSFEDYNINPKKLTAFLKVHDAKATRVPFRENRCVIFDSSLIHVTDELHFNPGYENRRVNVTLLYGRTRTTE